MFDWLTRLLAGPADPLPNPPPQPFDEEPPTMRDTIPTFSADVGLAIDKALWQLHFIADNYALTLFKDEQHQIEFRHDLMLMLQYQDLTHIKLELLDAECTIIFAFTVRFTGQRIEKGLSDSAQGIEVPLLNGAQIVHHRLVVGRQAHASEYQRWLKRRWSNAETLDSRTDQRYASEHARHITGGRQEAEFRVGDRFRHHLTVVRCGRRFAFGEAEAFTAASVFIPLNQVPADCQLRPGMRISAIIVQSPRGLQARCVQL